mgnify:CR=1 FL=1
MVTRVLFVLALVLGQVAHAELVIEVTQGKQSALPITVVPFEWNGALELPEDISNIVNQHDHKSDRHIVGSI